MPRRNTELLPIVSELVLGASRNSPPLQETQHVTPVGWRHHCHKYRWGDKEEAAEEEERPSLQEDRIQIGVDEVIEISDDDEIIEISDDDEEEQVKPVFVRRQNCNQFGTYIAESALETSERRKRPRSRSPPHFPGELRRDGTSVEDFLDPFKKLCVAVDSMCL